MAIISGFKKYKDYIQTSSGKILKSLWTSASTVEMANGNTAETEINNKVDKVDGKSLSTNDYTTVEKTKLSGIAEGATKVEVDTALSNTSENPVQNKVISGKIGEIETELGNSDISEIGDGTITGAISSLAENPASADYTITYAEYQQLTPEEIAKGYTYFVPDFPGAGGGGGGGKASIEGMTQAEYDALTDDQKNDGSLRVITDADGEQYSAGSVAYSNETSGLTANNVQAAIDEVNQNLLAMQTYSSDEQVVGTWLGETLYKKSYSATGLSTSSSITLDTNLNSNTVRVIKYDFSWGKIDGSYLTELLYTASDCVIPLMTTTSLQVLILNEMLTEYALTVYYTKK